MLRRPAEMQLLGCRHEASQLMQFHLADPLARPWDYIIFLYKPAPIESASPPSLGSLQA
jgi:hypothetical protein